MIYWIIVGLITLIFIVLSVFDYNKYQKIKHIQIYTSTHVPGLSMNADIVFDTANSRGNLIIKNYTCETVLIEIRNENDECVYTSKSIKQKMCLGVDYLSGIFTKGKYNCMAYVYSIDNELGSCNLQDSIPVTITILN